MCDYSQGFKLCSCGSDELDQNKPHWILHRKSPRPKDDFASFIVGEAQVDEHYGSELREAILGKLRDGNCFDQDFKIKQKDRLDFFTGKEWYRYELRRNGWQIYTFDFPGIKYEPIQNGIIEQQSLSR